MKFPVWIFLIFIIVLNSSQMVEAKLLASEMGTIVVNYQTDKQGERLDRIRFWLINENQEKILYPKKDEFVANSHTGLDRTVVITNLPIGKYAIEFLIPNKDHYFENIPKRTVELTENAVIKVDQPIHPRLQSLSSDLAVQGKQESEIAQVIINNYPSPFGLPYAAPYEDGFYPVNPYNAVATRFATFSLRSNQPTYWKLLLDNQEIFASKGPIKNLSIPPGFYTIIASQLPGFTLVTSPKSPFFVDIAQDVKMELYYQRDKGLLAVSFESPLDTTSIIARLTSIDQSVTLDITLYPMTSAFNVFKGPPIPTGRYQLNFLTPSQLLIFNPIILDIQKGQTTQLQPQFIKTTKEKDFTTGSLKVKFNTLQAQATLLNEQGQVVQQSSGLDFTADHLIPGRYLLKLTSLSPKIWLAPSNQSLIISAGQLTTLQVDFIKTENMTIKSDQIEFLLSVYDESSNQQVVNQLVTNGFTMLNLPIGKYRITFQPFKNKNFHEQTLFVELKENAPQDLYISSKKDTSIDQLPKPVLLNEASQQNLMQLSVSTNLSTAQYTLYDLSINPPKATLLKGKFSNLLIHEGNFKLIFEDIPNYITPQPVEWTQKIDEPTTLRVNYQPQDLFLNVPAGFAIVGDPFQDNHQNENNAQTVMVDAFAIAAYETTNSQYATWLTQAFQDNQIVFDKNLSGVLIDSNGRLICRTFEANSLAQITYSMQGNQVIFEAIPGKENYPVIEVSFYGAKAYCQSYDLRLPTENEWVKAAGTLQSSKTQEIQRFKYGFSQNVIDRSWANYRLSDQPFVNKVLTTPVGFYDGINKLPLLASDHGSILTHLAKSPWGAFDMSGNVWEWVAQESSTSSPEQIVKGGCYDSTELGVRVSERLLLKANHADIYTGFRAVKSL